MHSLVPGVLSGSFGLYPEHLLLTVSRDAISALRQLTIRHLGQIIGVFQHTLPPTFRVLQSVASTLGHGTPILYGTRIAPTATATLVVTDYNGFDNDHQRLCGRSTILALPPFDQQPTPEKNEQARCHLSETVPFALDGCMQPFKIGGLSIANCRA